MFRSLTVQGILILSLMIPVGCGWSFVADRKSNPIIKDYVGGTTREDEAIGVLGTTATHRAVIVRLNTQNGVGARGEFCPEPPPDVAQAIAESFAAALQAEVNAPTGQPGGSGAAGLASTFSSQISQLLRRSQGLQLYRDGMYYLCVAYINRIISAADYKANSDMLLRTAMELIKIEAANPAPYIPITVSASDPKEAATEILKKLQEALPKSGKGS
jgi:hypothetical protein